MSQDITSVTTLAQGGTSQAMGPATHQSIPLGVVVRRTPGVTRWARWHWQAVGVLPGAEPAHWRELRRAGEAIDYHAATVWLTLWAAETEAYLTALADRPPSVWAVMRPRAGGEVPFDVVLATASPFEAQDYADSGEEIVEKLAMPEGLIAWVEDFATRHHREQPFVKRRRDKAGAEGAADGRGDARIPQAGDVYRAPRNLRRARA